MMSRVLNGFLVIVAVVSVVTALVRAQEGWRDRAADSTAAQASSDADGVGAAGLGQQLESVGRSVASEYTSALGVPEFPPAGPATDAAGPTAPPAALLAADIGSLRSVLKRSGTPGSSSRRSQAATQAAPDEPAEGERPPIASVRRSPSDTTSSRRTFQSAVPLAPPAAADRSAIRARPISSRRVEHGAGAPGAHTASGTIASTAGPQLRVDTIGPGTIVVGEEAQYVVRVSNQSDIEAKQIQVRVGIPDTVRLASSASSDGSARAEQGAEGTRTLVWTVDRLGPKAEGKLSLRLVPLTNRPFQLPVEWVLRPVSSAAHIQVQQPMLEIALSGPSEIVYGDVRAFTVVLTNPGTGDAKNVSVYVSMGTAVADTLEVGTIPAGGSRKLDVEVTARQAGAMQLVATASGDNSLRAQATGQITVQRAKLRIEAVGPPLKFTGSVGTYQVRVANVGDATARKVQAAAYLPSGAKYVKGIENAAEGEDAISWPLGELAPGTERTYRFYCELESEGSALFRFAAREASGLQATSDVTTRVEAVADLKLEVADPKGPIPVGEDATYEIKVTNRGSKAATQVQILAQFSDGIEPVTAEGAHAEIVPGQVIFQPLMRIAPQETATLAIKAKAQTGGNHVFRAEVKCNDPETHLVVEDTTRYFGQDDLEFPAGPSVATPSHPAPSSPRIGTKPARVEDGAEQ